MEEQISSSSSSSNQPSSNIPFARSETDHQQRDGLSTETTKIELGREPVQREIEALRQKLQGRKKVKELGGDVAHAREEVIQCLQSHQRRPLDCWREVEAFKKQVARLEEDFVNRVL